MLRTNLAHLATKTKAWRGWGTRPDQALRNPGLRIETWGTHNCCRRSIWERFRNELRPLALWERCPVIHTFVREIVRSALPGLIHRAYT